MPDIARKQRKLMGHTFAQPITPEEVAGNFAAGDNAYGRLFYMITVTATGTVTIRDSRDFYRHQTQRQVATGLCHWDREQARRHLRALRYIMARTIKYAQ